MKPIIAALTVSVSILAHAQTSVLETRQIQSALRQGGVDLAWSRVTGRGVTIGIIDQGFDLTHGDFAGKITASQNFYAGGPVTWSVHGTQMAGIAAAGRNGVGTVGVAPDAKLMLAQVGAGGNSTLLKESSVYAALDWLSASGAAVINLSLGAEYTSGFRQSVQTNGRGGYFSNAAYGVNYGSTSGVLSEFALATNRGSILVVAAGNQALPYASFPAMYATRTDASGKLVLGGRMIVVGAVDASNQIASFSNRAGHLCQNSTGLTCRDTVLTRDYFVVAPGVAVLASVPNQLGLGRNSVGTSTGTSPATAYVSGGMALLKQAWPQLRPEQLVNLVLTTARDLGAPGTDDIYGRGLVDFNRASAPQGSLTVARAGITAGNSYGLALRRTGLITTSGFADALKTSSVLQNTQVLDSYGRNYTADLTRAIQPYSTLTNPWSPWLTGSLAAPVVLPLTESASVSVIPGNSGSAVQLNWHKDNRTWSLQSGTQQETSGFLGNQGLGALDLGSSNTSWLMAVVEQEINQNWSLQAQFGQGRTLVANSPLSMITLDKPVISQSMRLGLNQKNWVVAGDRVQYSIGTPVIIRRAQVSVTGVTGYDYEVNSEGEYDPVAQVKTERFRINESNRYTATINYQRPWTKNLNMLVTANQNFGMNQTRYVGVAFSWIQ